MPGPRVAALTAKLQKGLEKTEQVLSRATDEQWGTVVYADPRPWSLRDLLAHFVSAEQAFLELARDVARGGQGVPDGFDFDVFNAQEQPRLADRSPARLLDDLSAARKETLAWMETLSETDLDRVGRHPALGEITLDAMLTAIYGHQLLHMRDVLRHFGWGG